MSVRSRDIIYFDNNATTRVAPEVFEEMVPYLTEFYGNASSAYRFGKQVSSAVTKAREQVAALLACDPKEITFTSCGTESDNSAISSALQVTGHRHVVTTAVEHSAIRKQCEHLERLGYGVTTVGVRGDGTIDPDEVEKAIRDDTAIVSVMWANNETGVIFPIHEIAARCKARGVLFHTDAVQTPGKISLRVTEAPIDFLSLSGHKLHAPKGVGVLYIRRRAKFVPYLIGGSQEKGKRGGTENVASIVALGKAAELALSKLEEEQRLVKHLRDKLENGILSSVPDCKVNGNREQRLPNTSSIVFGKCEAEAILIALDQQGICASAGSACTTGSLEPSHVLTAMGISREDAVASIRFSFSRYNNEAEVDKALDVLPKIIRYLREHNPKAVDLANGPKLALA